MSEYDQQAKKFLDRFGLKFRTTKKGDCCPPYCDRKCIHGDRYRVTISRKGGGRIAFDFWNSYQAMRDGEEPSAYDVLACISGDVYAPEDFAKFCSEYGYDEDSRQAEATWKRVDKFARRLRTFFRAETEREALAEIA